MNVLTKTLIALVGLSLATTFLAGQRLEASAWGILVLLIIAGWKARLILNTYLGLAPSKTWRRAFMSGVTVLLATLYGLYLLPTLL